MGAATDNKIFGIPVKFGDNKKDVIKFAPVTVGLNADNALSKQPIFTNRNLDIVFKINFVRETETFFYIGYGDVFAKLGGIKAALGPILNITAPISVVFFLASLSKII
jgi:hypothetical protein